MRPELLSRLRCPYCGTPLEVADNAALVRHGQEIVHAVLGCECCAFPLVDRIPVLRADNDTRQAIVLLESGRHAEALHHLLGLASDTDRGAALAHATSYRAAIAALEPDGERTYFVHRFADPTYLVAEAILTALAASAPADAPYLDLCAGSGHMTWTLDRLRPSSAPPALMADLHLWKLWLARRFVSPGSDAVCCDAEAPLPFADDAFGMVLLADAFPYLWNKRLAADETLRVAHRDAPIYLPHLHSAWGENISAGDTLSPPAYRRLFAARSPRLFSDRQLLDGLLDGSMLELDRPTHPQALQDEPTVSLIATPAETFVTHPAPAPAAIRGRLAVNPLYATDVRGSATVLTLSFPTLEYEEEFGGCRRYLPEELTLEADLTERLNPAQFGSRYDELRRRRVLLDLPPAY